MTLGQRISAVLKNGALSVKDIAEQLEANENSVKTTLNRHKGDMFSIVNQDGFAPSWGNSFTPPA
jgi:DNA-binding CsgD family transcriptional regulator